MQTLAFGTNYLKINGQDYPKGDFMRYFQYGNYAEIEIVDFRTGVTLLPRTPFAQIAAGELVTDAAYASAAALKADLRANFFKSAAAGGGSGSGTYVDYSADTFSSTPSIQHIVTLTEADIVGATLDPNTMYVVV